MSNKPTRKRPRWDSIHGTGTADLAVDERLIDALYAQAFTSPDGEKVLAHMRHITIEARNAPGDSDGALRESEAVRNFVAKIEARVARHQSITTAKG